MPLIIPLIAAMQKEPLPGFGFKEGDARTPDEQRIQITAFVPGWRRQIALEEDPRIIQLARQHRGQGVFSGRALGKLVGCRKLGLNPLISCSLCLPLATEIPAKLIPKSRGGYDGGHRHAIGFGAELMLLLLKIVRTLQVAHGIIILPGFLLCVSGTSDSGLT
jgi:hypothetical protein